MANDRDRDEAAAGLSLHNTLRLSADGAAKALGDLEARVMAVVWRARGGVSARAVHEQVVKDHPVAVHTVITVLNRLVQKGLLRREKGLEVLQYTARMTEAEFLRALSRRAVEGILSLGPDAVAASFVDVLAERDPERLAVLARLVQARLDGGEEQ